MNKLQFIEYYTVFNQFSQILNFINSLIQYYKSIYSLHLLGFPYGRAVIGLLQICKYLGRPTNKKLKVGTVLVGRVGYRNQTIFFGLMLIDSMSIYIHLYIYVVS